METVFSQSVEGESSKAFYWFCRYRDMQPPRSLERLLENGTAMDTLAPAKKVSLRTLKRYSADYHWQMRVEAYETQQARNAFERLMVERQEKIHAFMERDLDIAGRVQAQVERKLSAIEGAEEIDIKELRHLAVAYKESRVWMQELLGISEWLEREDTEETA